MGNCILCCGHGRRRDVLHETVLIDREREAVADLLSFLERQAEVDFYSGQPLQCLATLSYSENIELRRSAALAFAEITEKDIRPISDAALEPILYLLKDHDQDVLRAASAAAGNLAVNSDNKLSIVRLNGLETLIQLMLSSNIEIQCNAVGCITNLATHDRNKRMIARSGALKPLAKLSMSTDSRVQRNATGAILNMTHSDENRSEIVKAGALTVLVSNLLSPDFDVQYYCTTAISNMAVDAKNRTSLAENEPGLVESLINLLDSPSGKIQCQAALALRNLASDDHFQVDIVRLGGLTPLLRLLESPYVPLVLSSVACIRNVSIHSANEVSIIKSGFLGPLVSLLSSVDNEEIQCHAISTLRNLAASNDKNKKAIVEAGTVQKCKQLILNMPASVQSEMTACIAVLALSDEIKLQILDKSILEVLIPLTGSSSIEVQGNSAAAIGNLSSGSKSIENIVANKPDDVAKFIDIWSASEYGMEKYLVEFLSSDDLTFKHIAIWTIIQLFESQNPQMQKLLKKSKPIRDQIEIVTKAGSMNSQIEGDEIINEMIVLANQAAKYLED